MSQLKLVPDRGRDVVSGTEPVVRVYCEAPAKTDLDRLLESAKAFVFSP